VDDTRIRIFVVLFLFGALFVTLAIGAARGVRGRPAGERAAAPVVSSARAELADRNGGCWRST
jgi:uncharacterized membrane protein YhiD involved in acid resistance